jgi:ribose 5-phosphate isomerase A
MHGGKVKFTLPYFSFIPHLLFKYLKFFMELRKETARVAFTLIRNNTSVGLGDGSTIRFLAEYIIEAVKKGLTLHLYSSSIQTQNYLEKNGIRVEDYSLINKLDLYFDGCDQVDRQLNAFKSGAGIHTTEKLLASMAVKFFILADESKFLIRLDNKFPLVLEVLPSATIYVLREIKNIFPGVLTSLRMSENNTPVSTRYGNWLVDCRFSRLPELKMLQGHCKSIPGVVETSLFYKIASGAFIAGDRGIRRIERKNNRVTLIKNYPVLYE